jgi:hypothetical protein
LRQHIVDIDRLAGEKVRQGTARSGRFRVQGIRHPLDLQVLKSRFNLVNAPGNEVAPGSDVVGENFQQIPFSLHVSSLLAISLRDFKKRNNRSLL